MSYLEVEVEDLVDAVMDGEMTVSEALRIEKQREREAERMRRVDGGWESLGKIAEIVTEAAAENDR